MNEQIFFSIKEAAQFLFPNRKGKGGEMALRRLCKAGQIECLKLGNVTLISRTTLLGFGVNSLPTASPTLRLRAHRVIERHKANEETEAN